MGNWIIGKILAIATIKLACNLGIFSHSLLLPIFSYLLFNLANPLLIARSALSTFTLSNWLFKLYQSHRQLAWSAIFIYSIATVVGIHTYYHSPYRYIGKTVDYRALISLIQTQEQPQDAIAWAIHHSRKRIALEHYYQGHSPIYIEETGLVQTKNPTQLITWLQTLPLTSRLWFVCWVGKNTQPLEQQLNEHYQIMHQHRFESLEVFLLTPKASASH